MAKRRKRTWQQISDEANYEPTISISSVDGHVDWQADAHIVAYNETRISAQAGGWRYPDGSLFAAVMFSASIPADLLTIEDARRTATALLSAADDAERIRDDADLVPAFSDLESAR